MEDGHGVSCKLCRSLEINLQRVSSHLVDAEVIVPSQVASGIQEYATYLYRNHAKALGLEDQILPESYVAARYADAIHENTCCFLLKFIVLDYLVGELRRQKLPISNQPRLEMVLNNDDGSLRYKFRVAVVDGLKTDQWKKFHFAPPRRKLYKDLDRQAQSFLEQEVNITAQAETEWTIQGEDWIAFEAALVNKDNKRHLRDHSNRFWIKISTKYLVSPFQTAFLGKKVGDQFLSSALPIDGMPSDALCAKGLFSIEVKAIVRGGHFSLELFKSNFELADEKEVHEKLIEIFSYRNDISQRRSIVEEAFRQLLSRSRFEIPRHLVLRRQELLLSDVRRLPDYHVYKAQEAFQRQLELLAEKQLKEEILVDHIAHSEDIIVSLNDIREYLNLFTHERLREFIYFRPLVEHFGESKAALREYTFAETVRREKTLNHIIKTLSKKPGRTPGPG